MRGPWGFNPQLTPGFSQRFIVYAYPYIPFQFSKDPGCALDNVALHIIQRSVCPSVIAAPVAMALVSTVTHKVVCHLSKETRFISRRMAPSGPIRRSAFFEFLPLSDMTAPTSSLRRQISRNADKPFKCFE